MWWLSLPHCSLFRFKPTTKADDRAYLEDFFNALNLLATTWADNDADAQAGKYTLAAQCSVSQLRQLYTLVAIAAFFLLILLHGWLMPKSVVYTSFLSLPMVIWGWRTYTRIHNPYPTSQRHDRHVAGADDRVVQRRWIILVPLIIGGFLSQDLWHNRGKDRDIRNK